MKYIYHNRYNDLMTFQLKNENEVVLTINEPSFLRSSFDEDDNIIMIDPSGGPYIEVGNDLGKIIKEFSGLIVKNIEKIEDNVFKFNCGN